MADRSIKVVLSANVAGYQAAMERAKKSTSDFASSASGYVRKHEAELNDLASASGKAGLALAAGAAFAVKSAMDWETAWTGVLKTVDGTPAQLAAIEDGLRGLAKETGFSAVEVAKVAENAGQLGVATENIVSFTDTMLALGVSTNLTADEAATSIAQMANVMGTSGGDIDNLASTLVALGNSGASTEAQIIQMAQRIAGAAKTVGMSEGEVLAFASTVASMGIEVEAGGTAVSTVISRMAQATQVGGAKLDAFARTAGMSSAQFVKAFKDEPTAAIQTFIEGLGKIQAEGGNVYGVLGELGLSDQRVSAALVGMASAGDLLSENLGVQADAWKQNTALMEESSKFYNTTSQQAKQAWASVKDSAITAGTALLPAVREVLDAVAGLANAFGSLPGPVQGGVAAVAAVGGTALLAVAGIAKLATSVATLQASLVALGATKAGTAAALGGLAKGAGVLVAVVGALAAADKIGERGSASIGKMSESLAEFAKTGKATGDIKDLFGDDMSGKAKRFANDMNSLGAAVKGFARHGDDNFLTEGFKFLGTGGQSSVWTQQSEGIKDMDAALVQLSQRDPEAALQAFQRLHDSALDGGASSKEFTQAFSGMAQIVGQAGSTMGKGADAAELLKGGLQDLGPAAQESAEALKAVEERKQAMRDTAWGFGNNFAGQVDLAKASLNEWLADLEKSATALDRWNENVVQGIRRGVDEGVIDKFREMGPEGARMLDQLVDGSRAGIERANRVFGQFTGGADLAAELDSIPADVVTQFKTRGAPGAIDTAVEVAKAAGLSDRQVTAVLTAMDYASGDIKKVLQRMATADRSEASPTVSVNDQATPVLGGIIGRLAGIRSKSITVTATRGGNGWNVPMADGGLLSFYANGGMREQHVAQIAPAGAMRVWAEPETGGEAYIPLAQDKRARSMAIWRETGKRLGAQPVDYYANGGISFRGHTLEYWEDRRMSGLELNQKRREIRDLERDLRETEKTKRGRRQKLRGLDRRIAQQELRQAKAELNEALTANKLNNSRGGSINERIKRRDVAAERAKERAEAAKQKREEQAQARQQLFENAANERESIFNTVKGNLTGGTISGMFDTSNPWVNPVNGKSMAAAAQDKVKAVRGYADALGRLAKAKAPQQVMQEIAGMGIYGGKQAAEALLADPAALKSISQSYAQIDQYAGLAGRYVAGSQPFATTQIQQIKLVNFKEGIVEITTGQSRNAIDASLSFRG